MKEGEASRPLAGALEGAVDTVSITVDGVPLSRRDLEETLSLDYSLEFREEGPDDYLLALHVAQRKAAALLIPRHPGADVHVEERPTAVEADGERCVFTFQAAAHTPVDPLDLLRPRSQVPFPKPLESTPITVTVTSTDVTDALSCVFGGRVYHQRPERVPVLWVHIHPDSEK